MEYVVVFFEGIITFISPCLLPLLPVYLSYFASGQEEEKNSLKNALGFVVGFTLVFIILGAFAGTVGRFLRERTVIVNIITGGIVIFFGLHFLGIIRIGFFNRTFFSRHESKEATFFSFRFVRYGVFRKLDALCRSFSRFGAHACNAKRQRCKRRIDAIGVFHRFGNPLHFIRFANRQTQIRI